MKFRNCVAAGVALALGAAPVIAQSRTGFTYDGIVRAVYSDDDLGTPGDSEYVNFLDGTGAGYVAITIEWFVPTATSNTISPSSTQTATDAQLIAAIQQYHALGIKVVLKPHVDLINYSTWRGQLAPTDLAAWFASYQAYLEHYADIAQQYGVEAFSVGTELKSLSVASNLSYWQTVIAAVRSDYTGPLMYGANATGAGDEFTTVSFWSLVDILGVDGYFGLTDLNNPTVAQLETAWTDSSSRYTGPGFNAVAALKNLSSEYNKPVVFTEVGYESSTGTNQQPYAGIDNGYDPTEQENCYTAFFNVFAPQSSWMRGVFWWALQLPVPVAGGNDQGWVMDGKPAGTIVLPQWFDGVTPGSTVALTATPNAVPVGSPVTLNASVANAVNVTPTGSVGFYYGSTLLGSGTVNSSGVASVAASSAGIPPNSYPITAKYSGDSNGASSSSTASVVVSRMATTTSLTATPTTVPANSTTTLQATVARTAGSGAPGGSVTFYYQSERLATVALNRFGFATYTASAAGVPAGTYGVTAQYSGDSGDAASVSPPVQVTVQ